MKLRTAIVGAAFAGLALGANGAVVLVTQDITTNTTWLSTNQYVLAGTSGTASDQGMVRVLPGVTLTIAGGTIIRGQPRDNSAVYDAGGLAVLRGAKIATQGSQGNPIIFTTAAVDVDANGVPDGFTRNLLPGAVGAYVLATEYNPGTHGTDENTVPWWDPSPKLAPKTNTMTGLWAGVIILGKAPVNYAGNGDLPVLENAYFTGGAESPYDYAKPVVEGLFSPEYGYGSDWGAAEAIPAGGPAYVKTNGINPDDDSGVFEYVSIRHGGIQLSPDNEVNGLTLGGVGRGTRIQFIEVWGNEDDGIEVFGGTVNMNNLVIIGTKDDGLDLDQGYMGQIQFVLVAGGSYSDHLLEWDGSDSGESNRESMPGYLPRAGYEVRNVTLIGDTVDRGSQNGGGLALIRRDAECRLYNSVFYSLKAAPLMLNTNNSGFHNEVRSTFFNPGLPTSTNDLDANTVFDLNATGGGVSATFSVSVLGTDLPVTMTTPGAAWDVTPSATAGANLIPLPSNPGSFKPAAYRGAFSNSANNATLWTNGWTAIDVTSL